jgi:GNAT superfamily N-acetyltransferase
MGTRGSTGSHRLPGQIVLKAPAQCAEEELDAFEALLRESGEVMERGLSIRIRAAACLGFSYTRHGELAAVAALKVPFQTYRDRVFRKAHARRPAVVYGLELGWFFVRPSARGHRLSEELARRLLEPVPERAVFATTRTDNQAMRRVLESLGFVMTGQPYLRTAASGRDELMLLVRPARRAAG